MAIGNVIGALFYLRFTTVRNVVLSRLRRLKQPKYLVGGVIGVAYFYFVFFRSRPGRPGPMREGPFNAMQDGSLSLLATLGAAALLVYVAVCWTLRRQRAALGFSEAEIAFLFPAPVSRQMLIHYRLISTALASVFSALLVAVLSTRMAVNPGAFVMRFVSWWLLFATLSLHLTGSSFTITGWMDRGASALRCQLIALAVVIVLVGAPLAWVWHTTPAGEMPGIASLQSGPVAWLLWPFRLVISPLLAADMHAFLLALGPALLVYAAHYLWVLRTQVSFEEASIAKAEKRSAALAAVRAGNWRLAGGKQQSRRAPFDLGRAWRPELAFLWKNLLASAPYLRLRNALIVVGLVALACVLFGDSEFFQDLRPKLAMVAAVIAAYTVVLGPQLARQDIRRDLPNTDILKTYPLHGWQIVLGEMLTPAVILSVLVWVMLAAGAILMPAATPRMEWLTPGLRIAALGAIAVLAPLLCVAQLLIVNTAAVLFPAWIQANNNPSQQGIDVMGQRIFLMIGQMLVLTLMLVPAGIAAALAFFLARGIAGVPLAAGLATVLMAGVLAAEIGAGITLLGRRFEQFDLSRELRP